MKYTQTTLDKLETIPELSGYVLRYERGSFQSGYCILEEKKVVVLNKFLQIEGRINTLTDLIPQLEINTEVLTEDLRRLYVDVISRAGTRADEAAAAKTDQPAGTGELETGAATDEAKTGTGTDESPTGPAASEKNAGR